MQDQSATANLFKWYNESCLWGFAGLKLQLPPAIITITEPPLVTLEVVTMFLHQDKLLY